MHSSPNATTRARCLLLGAALAAVFTPAALAQDPGPLPSTARPKPQSRPAPQPPPPPAQETYHSTPTPTTLRSPGDSPITNEPPAQPVDQIIKRFAEREAEFQRERGNYTYSQTFSIQTLDDDDRPDGEYRMSSDIIFTPDGKRFEKVTFAPPDTLRAHLP